MSLISASYLTFSNDHGNVVSVEFRLVRQMMNEKSQVAERFPKDATYVAVCGHGSSRSKFIAKEMGRMGYNRTIALGIQTSYLSRQEQIDLLRRAHTIICASTTNEAEVKHLLGDDHPPIVTLKISNRGHYELATRAIRGSFTGAQNAWQKAIAAQLESTGF